MFYLTTHSTHFIYGYMAPDRGNPLPPHGLLFSIVMMNVISKEGNFSLKYFQGENDLVIT